MPEILVYDTHGQRQSMPWLQGRYGNIKITHAPVGDEAFRIYRLQAREDGDSSINCHVLGKDGQPEPHNVAFHWPGADKQRQGCKTQPVDQFIHQVTNANGDTSFAMGHGSYYYPPDSGIHKLWVCSGLASDVIENMGMLSGSNHFHVDVWWHRSEGASPNPAHVPPLRPTANLPVISPHASHDCDGLDEILVLSRQNNEGTKALIDHLGV